ncbi:MAG: S41 family peptidase, partial [Bacteroidota bacterium]
MSNEQVGQAKWTRLKVWLPLLFSLTAVIGMVFGFKLKSSSPESVQNHGIRTMSSKGSVGKLEEMLRFIESKYVDDVDRDELIDRAIESILDELDPHSNYISKDQLKSVNESLDGHFDGIGVQIYRLRDTVLIVDVIPDGPSEKAGILVGDKLITVDDSLVAGNDMDNADIIAMLRGAKGDPVKIGVLRKGETDLRQIEVIRDKIPDNSVDTHYKVDDQTGYIKVSRFSSTTYEEFMIALEGMYDDGIEDLIIDLRGNPGGYLSAATKIADQLFDNARQLIVYTEGRSQRRNEYKSSGRNFFNLDNIAVLVDEGSASASEILAGAIQDWDRGALVGRRTFGKGLVQEQYKLSDGSALRLTVARYYTPSGRSIQKPYDHGEAEEYDHETSDRFLTGELLSRDSIKISDSTEYRTASGRLVFGGGGIIPDHFVPIEEEYDNRYFRSALTYIPEFVYDYLDHHVNQPNSFETINDFQGRFQVSDDLYDAFEMMIASKDIKGNFEDKREAKELLSHHLKAQFAQYYFKEEGYFYVLNSK